jgi:hypothetical protein
VGRIRILFALLGVLLTAAAIGLATGGAADDTSSTACDLKWTQDGTLLGKVTAFRVLPGGEKWAVGWSGRFKPTAFLAHQLNSGQPWSEVEERLGMGDAVSGQGRTKVFAVGHRRSAGWVFRFDGLQWRPVKPVPNGFVRYLFLAAARRWPWFATLHSAGAVFTWDGRQLRAVPPPPSRARSVGDDTVNAITATGPRHVWLVRDYDVDVWNGTSWSIVLRLPSGPNASTRWMHVDAATPTDVWAIAEYDGDANSSRSAHWDGHQWREFPYPETFRGGREFPQAVVAVSSTEAWLLLDDNTLLRWDGTAWTVQALPSAPRRSDFRFVSMDVDASNSVWLVGWGHHHPFKITGTSVVYHGTCR